MKGSQLLAEMIADELLETEAKSRNVTREAVLQAEVKKLRTRRKLR